MRKFAAMFIFALLGLAQLYAIESPFRGKSYSQRGILSFGGESLPISVHVKFFPDNSTALQMETAGLAIAKLKLDSRGDVLLCFAPPPLGESFAKKYVLPVFKAILLFDASYSRAYFDSKWQITSIITPRFKINFKDYPTGGKPPRLPHILEAEGRDFRLSLELVNAK